MIIYFIIIIIIYFIIKTLAFFINGVIMKQTYIFDFKEWALKSPLFVLLYLF